MWAGAEEVGVRKDTHIYALESEYKLALFTEKLGTQKGSHLEK